MSIVSCKNVSYVVPGGCFSNSKTILDDVSTIFRPGKLNVIMGSTGAGKTTLLNVIAKRVINRYVTGDVCIDGKHYTLNQYSRIGSYIMQQEYLAESLTVYETIQFAAKLSLNETNEEIQFRINNIIHKLNLKKCQDIPVGGPTLKGISGGQKKRTSIAFELIAGGDIIILDEPTSGMDSLTAHIIVKYLKQLATTDNKNIIMTIHQPNIEISDMFDNLTFLADGKIVYDGSYNEIQHKKSFQSNPGKISFIMKKQNQTTQQNVFIGGLLSYLSLIDQPCQQNINPVDHITQLGSPLNQKVEENLIKLNEKYTQIQKDSILNNIEKIESLDLSQKRQSVFFVYKLFYLLKRQFKYLINKPADPISKLFIALVVNALIGLIFFDVGSEELDRVNIYQDINSRTLVSAFSMIVIWLGIEGMIFKMLVFPTQRNYVLKQYQSGYYRGSIYFIVKLLADIPISIIVFLLEQLILYFMMGFSIQFQKMMYFSITLTLFSINAQIIATAFGYLIQDKKSIAIVVIAVKAQQLIFGGYIKIRTDYASWIGWLEYFSIDKYTFISLMRNQLQNKSPELLASYDFQEWTSIQNCIYIMLGLVVIWTGIAALFATITFRTHYY